MSNMSYCRFENTLSDLQDCAQALEEAVEMGDDPLEGLSEYELPAAKRLIALCAEIAKYAEYYEMEQEP